MNKLILVLGLMAFYSCEKTIHTDHYFKVISDCESEIYLTYQAENKNVVDTTLLSMTNVRIFHEQLLNSIEDPYSNLEFGEKLNFLTIEGHSETGELTNISDGLLDLNRWEIESFEDDGHLNHFYNLRISPEDFK